MSARGWPQLARRIRVPAGFALAAAYLWLARPSPQATVIGGAVALVGVALRAAASGHVRKNAELTTTGPYAYTRNPLYLGSVIIAAGLAIAARSWWVMAAMVAVFGAIYLPVIRDEEDFLRSRFPEFGSYCQSVPRLLPRLRAVYPARWEFSGQLYWKHREYNALIGTAAMLAALAAKFLWFER